MKFKFKSHSSRKKAESSGNSLLIDPKKIEKYVPSYLKQKYYQ